MCTIGIKEAWMKEQFTVYVSALTKWRGERERGEGYVLSMILSLFFIVIFCFFFYILYFVMVFFNSSWKTKASGFVLGCMKGRHVSEVFGFL